MRKTKIVVTGGPSGGKTTLIEGLKKELGETVVIVPEAASLLYRGGFPRFKSRSGIIHTQRAIYLTQKELEALLPQEDKKAQLIVCDRGSLDGIAYWPSTRQHFFDNLKSSRRAELSRYDWVLHLDTASRKFYDVKNPIRLESYDEASSLNERVKRAWAGHPRRFIVGSNEDFLSKMTVSLAVIRAILDGMSYEKIQKDLLQG